MLDNDGFFVVIDGFRDNLRCSYWF